MLATAEDGQDAGNSTTSLYSAALAYLYLVVVVLVLVVLVRGTSVRISKGYPRVSCFRFPRGSCARLQASGSIEWAEVSGSPARGQLRSREYVVSNPLIVTRVANEF